MRCSIQSIRAPTATVWSDAVTGREKLSAEFAPFTRRKASGSPIRSIPPSRILRSESPASNSANLMLDEPPLIVRMRALAGFMDGSFVILQSERSQLRARGPVIRVENTLNPQAIRDLDKHRRVFDIDYLPGRRLGDVQRKSKDVG